MPILSIPGLGSVSIWIPAVAGLILWLAGTVTYRLWLGPLAAFPGPKLAALTGWYEAYFDCLKRGRYWIEIERMHAQYGKDNNAFAHFKFVLMCKSRPNRSDKPMGIARG
jgi:hypothetical protein